MFELIGDPPMVRTAAFSHDRKYRYELRRIWDRQKPLVHFVLLNPSTADGELDDPTVRRCLGFGRGWGFGGIIITNLFALRSTDPAALKTADDPVGPQNDAWIAQATGASDETVFAWGIHGELLSRDRAIGSLFKRFEPLGIAPKCFGRTKCGAPLHPLYLRADHPLQLWKETSSHA